MEWNFIYTKWSCWYKFHWAVVCFIKAQPCTCITRRYTTSYAMFQERDRIMHHLVVHLMHAYIHAYIPVPVIVGEKIGFYSFYRSNSSLARSFISSRKTRKRGHRAYDKLFPGETRRHFQSSAIRRMTE